MTLQWYYTLIQTHKVHNTKSEPYNQLWALGGKDTSVG
jgi:hypothetical protein